MKTMYQYLDDYFEWRRSLKKSGKTIKKNKRGCLPFIKWLKDRYQADTPDKICKEHLHEWQKHIGSRVNKDGYPLKPRTINTYQESIRGFLRYLFTYGHMYKDLTHEIQYVKKPQTLPGSVLSHAQMRSMLMRIRTDTLTGYRDRAILELLYSSGIRVGELLGIDISHVDLKQHTMMVTGKGNKQRIVPIGATALRYLETYIVAVRPNLLKDKTEKALFLANKGQRLKYQTLANSIHAYAAQNGYENVTPHTFRRSCTTELIRGGANMYHVKELLGHECLDTLNHYVKLTINDLKKTHEKCHPRENDSN